MKTQVEKLDQPGQYLAHAEFARYGVWKDKENISVYYIVTSKIEGDAPGPIEPPRGHWQNYYIQKNDGSRDERMIHMLREVFCLEGDDPADWCDDIKGQDVVLHVVIDAYGPTARRTESAANVAFPWF